jgi:hypothetical protein
MFEAYTDRIPPKGTPVRVVLIPRQPEQKEGQTGSAAADKKAQQDDQ